ncbi:MAG: urease accessory protein UreF [Pseudomonadota bacterium]
MDTDTDQTDSRVLPDQVRMLTWFSAAFPTGAFAYSHGLERAVHDGLVSDRQTLETWLADLMAYGTGWNDAIVCAHAWRAAVAGEDCRAISDLAIALHGSSERALESLAQGNAFVAAARAWPAPAVPTLPQDCPLPVAVGAVTGCHGIPRSVAVAAFLQSFVNGLVQGCLRLLPIGQQAGLEIIAALEPRLIAIAEAASEASLDDLGSATLMSEIVAMKHETQSSRIFRS